MNQISLCRQFNCLQNKYKLDLGLYFNSFLGMTIPLSNFFLTQSVHEFMLFDSLWNEGIKISAWGSSRYTHTARSWDQMTCKSIVEWVISIVQHISQFLNHQVIICTFKTLLPQADNPSSFKRYTCNSGEYIHHLECTLAVVDPHLLPNIST